MTVEKMIQCCGTLTPTESLLAEFVLSHMDEIGQYRIQELAEKCFVSKSAIHRFCKKIGVSGYNELKVKIARDLKSSGDNKVIDVNFPFEAKDSQQMIAQKLMHLYYAAITDTNDLIDAEKINQAVMLIYQAKVVDIYTHAHNMNVADNFKDKMRSIGKMTECPKSFYEQRCTAIASDKSHVALILSYSGKATFLPAIINALEKKNIPIIMISKAGNFTFDNKIKCKLYISDKENLRFRIAQFSSHIAMQYMLDVIFSCVFKINYQKNLEYLKEVIEVMDDRKIEEEHKEFQK